MEALRNPYHEAILYIFIRLVFNMKDLTHIIIIKSGLKLFYLFIFCTLILKPIPSVAQETSDVDPAFAGETQLVAPVKVDGNILFNVRGISSYTAEQRASTISKRIRKAAAIQSISIDSVRIVESTDHSKIYAGSEFVMNVYDADAERDGVSRLTLAIYIRDKVKESIGLHRLIRSRPVIMKKVITAGGSVILISVLIILLIWVFRKIDKALQKKIKARIDSVENMSFSLIRSHQLWSIYNLAFKFLRIIIFIILIAISLEYILGLLPWTSNLASNILNLLLDPVISIGSGILNYLPKLFFLIVIYLAARYFLKLSKLLFSGLKHGGITIKNFDPDWAMPTYKIFRVFVVVFAVVVAYPYIPGSGTSAFKGISVFIGVLFSLGSSSFISNLIAGYTITYRGAYKKGDYIQIGDQSGFVQEQEVLVTRMLSIKNEEIVIPNSVLLTSSIINYSTKAKEDKLIIHTTVGIGYETPWRMVDAMLKLAVERTDGLLKQPPPFVLKTLLGDFAVTYEINAYCNDSNRLPSIYSTLHQNILDVFNENNVQIMTPAYMHDPDIPKVVPKDQWDTPLAGELGKGSE